MCNCVVCQVSLGCIPNDPKSVKSKNGICICVCMCLCTFLFLCVCVPFINLISLAYMPNKPKCEFLKKFSTLRILLIDA